MPGLLTSLFDPDDHSDGRHTTSQDSTDLGAHSTIDPAIDLHLAEGGSYSLPDGTEHQWSAEQDIALHTNVSAAVDTVIDGSGEHEF